MEKQPIGVFDSGVGGLTILRELIRRLPDEDFLYVADQAHVPYGPRPMEEVRRFSFGIVDFLLGCKAKLVVVACNTISAAALQPLRAAYPGIPFVGLEPAVKPAAKESRSGVIGVIATEATFQGELFASVVNRFGGGVKVITRTLPGLVERIEAGQVKGPELERFLRERLQPLLAEGIDELVLGCTHYPLVAGTLQKAVGPGVQIVDPSPAVARQAEQLLRKRKLLSAAGPGKVAAFTSGDVDSFSGFFRRTVDRKPAVGQLAWSRAGENWILSEGGGRG
jgi:glutamate racemase